MTAGAKLIASCAILTILAACSPRPERHTVREGPEPVVSFRNGDPEMSAAEDKARASLNQFIDRFHHPKPNEIFSVKAKVSVSSDMDEMIWLERLEYADGRFSGILTDDPATKGSPYKKGSHVSVGPDGVVDWIIIHDGTYEGGYTQDVMAKQLGRPGLPR